MGNFDYGADSDGIVFQIERKKVIFLARNRTNDFYDLGESAIIMVSEK